MTVFSKHRIGHTFRAARDTLKQILLFSEFFLLPFSIRERIFCELFLYSVVSNFLLNQLILLWEAIFSLAPEMKCSVSFRLSSFARASPAKPNATN